jgi:hypothetical protein
MTIEATIGVGSLRAGEPRGEGMRRANGMDAGLGSGLGRAARLAKLGSNSMKRGAVRSDGVEATLGSGLGREAWFAKPGSDSMKRGAVRSDGAEAALGSGLAREARFAKPGSDSMKRGAVRADGMEAALGSGLGREARFAKPGSDSMKRGAVRADGVEAALGSGLGREAWGAKPGSDSMKRGAVRRPWLAVDRGDEPAPPHRRRSPWQRGWPSFQCRRRPGLGCRLPVGAGAADAKVSDSIPCNVRTVGGVVRRHDPHPGRCATRPLPRAGEVKLATLHFPGGGAEGDRRVAPLLAMTEGARVAPRQAPPWPSLEQSANAGEYRAGRWRGARCRKARWTRLR